MKHKRGLWLILLVGMLAFSLILAGCGSGSSNTATNKPTDSNSNVEETITFGAALPITGNMAPSGKSQKEGYELWKNTINAKGGIKVGEKTYKVDIKYYDYASDVNTAVKLVEKLIVEDKVKYILGPYGSTALAAVAPIVEKYSVIMMAASGASPTIYKGHKYTFGTLTPSATYAAPWLEAMRKADPTSKTLAILGQNDLFPLDMAKQVQSQASKYGFEVVAFETYPLGAKDLTTSLTAIKSKNPELFFFTGAANDSMLAIRQAKQIGLKVKAFGATTGLTSPDFLLGMKGEANDITSVETWFSGLPDSFKDDLFGTPKDFAALYKKTYNYEFDPPYITASAAVDGYILQKSIERAGTIDPTKVRDVMSKFNETTFYGPIKFDENGQLQRNAFAMQLEYPDIVSISPGLETGKIVYPMRW